MRRIPNHRFSLAKDRTVTPFESVLDSIKQHMPNPLKRTTGRQESLRGKSPVSSLKLFMGSKSKKGEDRNDLGDTPKGHRQETGFTRQSNGKRNQIRDRNEDWTSAIPESKQDDETSEGEGSSDAQADLDLDPYLARVKDLNMKLEASRTAVEHTLGFYTQHQREIQKIDSTRQQLKEMREKCIAYGNTISGLQRLEREKEQEADRLLQFQEKKTKLESEQDKRYAKRVEDLEKEMKKSQDDDRKKISDLQAKNNELVQDLEKERRKLKAAEKSYKDIEKLRSLSEAEAEMLSQKLKVAENEFGLDAQSTEYL
ncbi:hypothetical protein BJ875DRAFT_526516 [Amylocarpus encephaloides]|uniref:Uncharacterized protein n=1 Tax=Amylocarpus encephaloides TaxID=45428 RepID=A0A9P7YM45_9HELO|nr:hypothetical protein BJ875DRAFT_526516 [Amylocarpus encephaloides]